MYFTCNCNMMPVSAFCCRLPSYHFALVHDFISLFLIPHLRPPISPHSPCALILLQSKVVKGMKVSVLFNITKQNNFHIWSYLYYEKRFIFAANHVYPIDP